jgi:hypothetical protein
VKILIFDFILNLLAFRKNYNMARKVAGLIRTLPTLPYALVSFSQASSNPTLVFGG